MPTGMLNDVPQARADFDSQYRHADEYEYLNADPHSPYAVSGDGLIDCCYRVAPQYRANGTWVMNSSVLAEVRKLKSTDGVYLWQPGLGAGQPPNLLGYPVQTWEQMCPVAAIHRSRLRSVISAVGAMRFVIAPVCV